jgi:hypothetical protein
MAQVDVDPTTSAAGGLLERSGELSALAERL